MTTPDRIRERLIDEQGNVNSGVARVRCVSLARAVVELLEALDGIIAGLEASMTDEERLAAPPACLDNARLTAERQRSRFDL